MVSRRICFVLPWHPHDAMGGAEIQAWFLARELARRGWQVHYVSQCADWRARQGVRSEGVCLHGLPVRRSGLALLNYGLLRRTLKAIDAGILYQRTAGPYTGMAVTIAKRLGSRCVWAMASMQDCAPLAASRRWRWRGHAGWRAAVNLPFLALGDAITALGVRGADCIVAQSAEQREMLRRVWRRDAVVIPNGHPVPTAPVQKAEPAVVAWIATLNEVKRPELFAELAAACLDLDVRFVMAGRPVEAEVAAHIARRAANLPNLSYLGAIPLDEANDLLAQAALFVNTSLYEGFPNSFIQSWLRSTPTVSLSVDPDGVIERHGLGVHAGSLPALVTALRRLLAGREERDGMASRARRYAESEHSLSLMADRYEACLLSVPMPDQSRTRQEVE